MAIGIREPIISPLIDDADTSLMEQLEVRAPVYFPHLDPRLITIRLIQDSRRMYSAFYEFEISDGTHSHGVIVKIPYLPSLPGTSSDNSELPPRPRLFGLVEPTRMAELEFTSLTAIQSHFENLDNSRFGTIRPLELLREPNAVVMEKNHDTSLRLIHRTARRFDFGSPKLPFSPADAIQNAAAWLREYHQIVPLPQTLDRMPTRSEFITALQEQADHLVGQGENRDFLRHVRSQMEDHAQRSLPAQFELATSHGDYALRNLLIGEGSRVTVLDTLARWRAPKYEDVASFLLALRAPAAQVVSFGAAYSRKLLHQFESQFLTYYFDGEPIPLPSVRLFEGLLLLDRWGAFVQRTKTGNRGRKLYYAWRLVTLRRFMFQYFRHTFRELDQLR